MLGLALVLGLLGLAAARPEKGARASAPRTLAETGLYSDFATRTVDPANLPFTPQYPLWSDGATKQRWIRLPAGSAIDARDADRWVFPIGTRLWKEFRFGRRVETRYMERAADSSWIYAAYAWSEDEREAVLVADRGQRGACEIGAGVRHDIPSVADCRACHQGNPAEVLGFSALQLSRDRDPLAPHAEQPIAGSVDLVSLVERGSIRGLASEHLERAPRIEASTPRARAALGYLHGNCGHCHNARGPLADLGLELDVPLASSDDAPALRTAVGVDSRFRLPKRAVDARIAAGDPDQSVLARRMSSRNPLVQMPPLGTRLVDDDALALVGEWIRSDVAGASDGAATALRRHLIDLIPERRQP